MIVNTSRSDHAKRMGNAHLRLGNDSTAYSTTNPEVKSNIIEGGFFELDLQASAVPVGQYLTLRRVGRNFFNRVDFSIA